MSLIVIAELDFLEVDSSKNQLKGGFLFPNQPARIPLPSLSGKGTVAFSDISSNQNGTETQISSYSVAEVSPNAQEDSLTLSSVSSSLIVVNSF